MKPRHNEASIQAGIAMFKRACSNAVALKGDEGQTYWHGSSCAGGGATIKHRMHEDTMTLRGVAFELGHVMYMKEWAQGIKDLEAKLEQKYSVQ